MGKGQLEIKLPNNNAKQHNWVLQKDPVHQLIAQQPVSQNDIYALLSMLEICLTGMSVDDHDQVKMFVCVGNMLLIDSYFIGI